MKNSLLLFVLTSVLSYSQTFTEINPTALSADGSGIYVNSTGYRTANDITVYPNIDFRLNQISFNAVVDPGGVINSVDIIYHEDDNGKPGNIISTQTGLVPFSQDYLYTGEWGTDVKEVILNIDPIVLNGQINQATTYWISLVASVSGTAIAWWELTQGSSMGARIFEKLSGIWTEKGYGDGVYVFSGTEAPMSGLSCNPIEGQPEYFETADITTHCWSLYNEDNEDPGFVQTGDQAHEGSFSFYHASTDLDASASSFLVSPALAVNFFDVLSFSYYQHNTANFGTSKVLISTTSNDPLNDPEEFKTIVSLDETSIGGFSENTWTHHKESLRNYSGETVYIAFMYSGDLSHELYIDDFLVSYDNLAWDDTIGAMHVNVLPEYSAIDITDNYVIGSNVYATNSSTINGTPSCGDFNGGDIWIKFEAPETGAVQIAYPIYTSFAFSEVAHALYDDPLSTNELFCGVNGAGWNNSISTEDEFVYFTGLTPEKMYYLRIWDTNNDNFGNFYFCLKAYTDPSALIEESSLTNILIYPNPTKEKVSILFTNVPLSGKVTIFDLSGKIVYKQKLKASLNHEMDLVHLDKGLYFVKLNLQDKTIIRKLIKE